jgi:hypothetical protein
LWNASAIGGVLRETDERGEGRMTIALTLIFALNLYQRTKRWEQAEART